MAIFGQVSLWATCLIEKAKLEDWITNKTAIICLELNYCRNAKLEDSMSHEKWKLTPEVFFECSAQSKYFQLVQKFFQYFLLIGFAFFSKMGHSRTIFLYFRMFHTPYRKNTMMTAFIRLGRLCLHLPISTICNSNT